MAWLLAGSKQDPRLPSPWPDQVATPGDSEHSNSHIPPSGRAGLWGYRLLLKSQDAFSSGGKKRLTLLDSRETICWGVCLVQRDRKNTICSEMHSRFVKGGRGTLKEQVPSHTLKSCLGEIWTCPPKSWWVVLDAPRPFGFLKCCVLDFHFPVGQMLGV